MGLLHGLVLAQVVHMNVHLECYVSVAAVFQCVQTRGPIENVTSVMKYKDCGSELPWSALEPPVG